MTQFTLVDETITYTDDGYAGDLHSVDHLPHSWTGAENFKDGTVYIRLEVLEKPDSHTTSSVLCRMGTGTHHDRSQVTRIGEGSVTFNCPGEYYFTLPVSSARPLVDQDNFNWSSRPTFFQIVCADANGRMVSRHEHDLGTYAGDLKDYLPLKVRYTAIVVAKGAVFVPPADWKSARLRFAGDGRGEQPGQFLVTDYCVTYTPDSKNVLSPFCPAHGFAIPYGAPWYDKSTVDLRPAGQPMDWRSPSDFTRGMMHMRVEIYDKPDTATPCGLVLRMTSTSHEGHCTAWWNTKSRYIRPGTYYHEQRVDSFESYYGKNWRFDQPIYECQLFVIDDKRGVICNYFENRNVPLNTFLPLRARFTAYAVSYGRDFVKPDFWDELQTEYDPENCRIREFCMV